LKILCITSSLVTFFYTMKVFDKEVNDSAKTGPHSALPWHAGFAGLPTISAGTDSEEHTIASRGTRDNEVWGQLSTANRSGG
jgi:hypothetical protein